MPACASATEPDVCLPSQPTADLRPKTAASNPNFGTVAGPRPQPAAAGHLMRRFALISAGLHAALIGGLILWFYRGPRMVEAPDSEGAVQLVMVEQQGTGATVVPPVPAPQTTPAPPQTAAPPPPPEPDKTTDADEALPLPPPVPPPVPAQSATKPSTPTPPTAAPPMQQAVKAPTINLGGTDSETNAIASGDHVVPATVDGTYHNKEPIYPSEAARRAQQGLVLLLIHVSPDGLTQSVDIEKSSGFQLLDQAARNAVEGWHFLPAVKDGQPVPFDMQLRVLFHLD